jgi:hypothetical protein
VGFQHPSETFSRGLPHEHAKENLFENPLKNLKFKV